MLTALLPMICHVRVSTGVRPIFAVFLFAFAFSAFAQQATPVIASVSTAYGPPNIAQNTWIGIKGTNLAPATTPSGGIFWSNAPDFASNRMPTQLGGISVTVNGKPAYIWWFCSAATTSFCASDQINVLTPLDNTIGAVQVVVTNGTGSSAPFTVTMQSIAPSFLLFNTHGYIVATHANFSLLGPTSLYAGLSTPAQPGETILLFGVGFGLPTTPLVDGSASQSGPLPALPACTIGSAPATVSSADLITPGLYQLNVIVPAGVSGGDNAVSCTYNGSATPSGALISVSGAGSGFLQLQITGLPSGTAANVAIASSNGFNTVATTSQDLQVPSGTYALTVNSVPVGNVYYGAFPAQQSVNVSSGSSVAVQVLYNVVFPQTTITLDQQGIQGLSVSPDGSTISLSATSQVAQSLSPGHVLVIGITPATPNGLLRKVVSVSQNGSQMVATTSQATLADAFQQANFTFTTTITPQTSSNVQALRPGVAIVRAANTRLGVPAAAVQGQAQLTCPSDATLVKMSQTPIAEDENGTITATGSIQICPTLEFDWNLGGFPPVLNSLTATITYGVQGHVGIFGRYDNSFGQKVAIGTITSDPIPVFIAGFPIVLTPIVTFYLGASGELNAGFSVGATETASVTGGISFANGQISPVFSKSTSFTPDPVALDAQLTAKAYIGLTADLNVDGVLSPEFSPDAYLQLDVNPLADPWWALSGGLEGSASVKVGIFGVELADFSEPDLFQFSLPIAQATGGFSIAAATPVVSSITPNLAPAGSVDLMLAVAGSNFVPGATVRFDGRALSTSFVSPTQIGAVLPASDLTVPGTFQVVVTNPDDSGAVSKAVSFTVTGAGSGITISPASVSVPAGGVQTFSATISGGGAVTWSVQEGATGGTITNAGIYTAPAVNGTFHAIATSVTNPSESATATVTIVAAVSYTVLHSFTGGDGSQPPGLIQATDGNFYGVTLSGGASNRGTAFNMTAQGSVTTLHSFSGTDGYDPAASLVQASDGNFYGTTIYGGGTTCVIAGTSTTAGCGTAFRMDAPGDVRVLHSFSNSGSDGFGPFTPLIPTSDGGFYGTAGNGGNLACTGSWGSSTTPISGCGTVFSLASSGAFSVSHTFSGSDGSLPTGLGLASDGSFYGTTGGGGDLTCASWYKPGCGVIFKLGSTGVFTILHSFHGPDGAFANGMIQAVDGSFYGTAAFGGDLSCTGSNWPGCGTIFKVDPAGNLVILHTFTGPDGKWPSANLFQDSDGNFYGTTEGGGDLSCTGRYGPGCGTVFKMDAAGNITVLHVFTGQPSDGSIPLARLIQGKDGNLYGTTSSGGSDNDGVVFRISNLGAFSAQNVTAAQKIVQP